MPFSCLRPDSEGGSCRPPRLTPPCGPAQEGPGAKPRVGLCQMSRQNPCCRALCGTMATPVGLQGASSAAALGPARTVQAGGGSRGPAALRDLSGVIRSPGVMEGRRVASSTLPGVPVGHGDRAMSSEEGGWLAPGAVWLPAGLPAPAEGSCWSQKAAEQEVGPGGRPPCSHFCADVCHLPREGNSWGGLGRPPQ